MLTSMFRYSAAGSERLLGMQQAACQMERASHGLQATSNAQTATHRGLGQHSQPPSRLSLSRS